nr:reverse transcriptase domain-containing protein [Tanacetum cinerariifolium]
MPSHIKTYDGSEDPKDHIKIFQTAAKTERWAMPTSCDMFNSTLTRNARVWFDDLPTESIDSYDDLKKAFLENYLQQKKCIKDPIELHNIKHRHEESTENFMRRKDVALNKRAQTEQWKIRTQGSKERRSLQEGQSISHSNGPALERVARQKITQSFSPNMEILFPPLDEEEETEDNKENTTTGKDWRRQHSASAWVNIMVVRSPSPYNGIIRRPGVTKLQAVPSTAHRMLELPVEGGVITLKSSRQKKRGQGADRNQAIQEEVGRLVEAGIIKEVHYHDWLSNPVMTTEAEEAFKQMKHLIADLPMLTAPMEKEELIFYLTVAKETSIELGEYAIHYRPRVLVKGQILADFIAERPEEDSSDTLMEVEEELLEPWILFTDGSSCTDGSGAGLILTNIEGMEFTYALRFKFNATNI